MNPSNTRIVDQLREKWERAIERDKHADAVKALRELEEVDPDEPLWSHRLGESYRRLGKLGDAEVAFARAAERYYEKGFFPRAIAMAKLVSSMNPARADLLEQMKPKPREPSLPLVPPLPVKPVPLARAKDALDDEVRFEDVEGPPSISFVIEDVSVDELLPESSLTVEVSDSWVVDDPSQPPAPAPPPPPPPPPPRALPGQDRLAAMAAFRLFADVSREALHALASAAELVEFVPGAMVVLRDEPAVALYAIVDGTARVVVRGAPATILREGDVFGEACLLDEGTRQADVRAEFPLMTLRIGKRELDAITNEHAEVGEALFGLLARRLVMNLMHTSPLFSAFEPAQRLELSQMFEVRRADPGTTITERGRRSDALYVLLAGQLSATDEGGHETRISRGTAFGQASLLGGGSAANTVQAVTEAVLLRLPAAKFAALAALYPPALAYLTEVADQPLRASVLPD